MVASVISVAVHYACQLNQQMRAPAPPLRHRAAQRRHRPGTLVVTRLRHHRRHAADQAAAALADAAPGPLPHRLLHRHRQVHRSVPNGDLLSGGEGEVGEGRGWGREGVEFVM